MEKLKNNKNLKALTLAFPHTLPIMAGFLFLGISYGIYMQSKGFSFLYPILISITVFAGSMQFAAVNLLLGAFDPLQAFIMTLMVNARHLFYGISLLEKYRGTGLKKLYLIFGLCDESFSINCSVTPPDGVDSGKFMFFVTLLNQCYWVTGATLGGIFGNLISFNVMGIEFVMTAMFVVIFTENWLKEKNYLSSLLGLLLPILCLIVLGKDGYIIPSMLIIMAALLLLQPYFNKREAVK